MIGENGKRIFKQYLIINKKGLRVNYGTTDKNNPSVIYIRAKGDIMPIIEKSTYVDDIKELKNKFRRLFLENVKATKELKIEKFICNLEISEKSITYNKKAHLRYDIFIKPSEIKQLKQYENDIKLITENVNKEMSEFLKKRGIISF